MKMHIVFFVHSKNSHFPTKLLLFVCTAGLTQIDSPVLFVKSHR